jgi:hypothetical protein
MSDWIQKTLRRAHKSFSVRFTMQSPLQLVWAASLNETPKLPNPCSHCSAKRTEPMLENCHCDCPEDRPSLLPRRAFERLGLLPFGVHYRPKADMCGAHVRWTIGKSRDDDAASFRLDVGRPDHLAPFLGFIGDQLAEVGR